MGGKYDSRKFKFAERVDYSGLRDFVVYIDQPFAEETGAALDALGSCSAKGRIVYTACVAIVVGTTVEWPNHDEIYHNAFSCRTPNVRPRPVQGQGQAGHLRQSRDVWMCSVPSIRRCTALCCSGKPYFALADAKGAIHHPGALLPVTYRLKHGTSVCLSGPGSHWCRRRRGESRFPAGDYRAAHTDPSCVLRGSSFKTKVLLPVVATWPFW